MADGEYQARSQTQSDPVMRNPLILATILLASNAQAITYEEHGIIAPPDIEGFSWLSNGAFFVSDDGLTMAANLSISGIYPEGAVSRMIVARIGEPTIVLEPPNAAETFSNDQDRVTGLSANGNVMAGSFITEEPGRSEATRHSFRWTWAGGFTSTTELSPTTVGPVPPLLSRNGQVSIISTAERVPASSAGHSK